MEPILIGLIAIALLARKAINLTHPRVEEVAHQPVPMSTLEEAQIEVLVERYNALADLHTRLYLRGETPRALDEVREDMRAVERDLTLRGHSTPTCS